MSWEAGLQIIGIIVTTSGTLLAIESLWRLRLQKTIKFMEDSNREFGITLLAGLFLKIIFAGISQMNKSKEEIQTHKKHIMSNWQAFKFIFAVVVQRFSEWVEDVLRKIYKHLIGIGVSLIIVGSFLQILSVLI